MDQYKVIRKLGQGSQSVSYLACPVDKPNELVVLKRMASGVLRPADVSVYARLRHPNVVPCLAVLQHEDQLVIAQPFYEGGDLEHHVDAQFRAKQQRPDTASVVRWTVQLARALQHCHEYKMIHRDLRLGSVFLSADAQQAFLGGFGLARALDKTMSAASTLVGTPVNLSPEVISGAPFSPSSDVWSLGCLVFELLTGDKPFAAASFAQVVLKVCNGQYAPLPPTVPRFLAAAVAGMLQVDPKQRWLLAEVIQSDAAFLAADRAEERRAVAANAAAGAGGAGAGPPRARSQSPRRNNVRSPPREAGAASAAEPAAAAAKSSAAAAQPVAAAARSAAAVAAAAASTGADERVVDEEAALSRDAQRLSAAEELSQWVQWKHREFDQIAAALRRIGEPALAADPARRVVPAQPQQQPQPQQRRPATPETPPANLAGAAVAAAARLHQAPALDPRRAQRQLPSPRKAAGAAVAMPGAAVPAVAPVQPQVVLPPRGGRRAGPAAAGPFVFAAQPANGQLMPTAAVAAVAAAPAVAPVRAPPARPVPAPGVAGDAAAAIASSAERRVAQRAELQRMINEGRRTQGSAASPELVVVTPSRALQDAFQSAAVNLPPPAAAPPAAPRAAPPAALAPYALAPRPAAGAPLENASPVKPSPARPSLKDEIARRRAEALSSPRAAKDGPELQIVVPANLRRALGQ